MFSIALRNADHIRRYTVSVHTPFGWEVTTERDGETPRRVYYRDWERVEAHARAVPLRGLAAHRSRLAAYLT
jgi:hypothetical protein